MIIGIIGAMDEELESLLKETTVIKTEIKAQMKFYFGKNNGDDIVIVRCGIGKVNAAVCVQILVDIYDVDKIINVGVAGGLKENVLPGDVVIADSLVQHDMDTSYFGDEIGQIPRLKTFAFNCDKEMIEKAKIAASKLPAQNNVTVGRIVTGDQFVSDPQKILWLKNKFNASACEMEGGSIAQVCYLNNIPFVVIRSISDNSISGVHMEYEKFKPIAIKNSTIMIKNLLKLL